MALLLHGLKYKGVSGNNHTSAINTYDAFESRTCSALNTFRDLLRQSWIRRAIRGLSMEQPADILSNLTLNRIKAFWDSEWVEKEKTYHESVAPYAVRRAYYIREVEIQRLYDDCAEDILRAIADRAQETCFFGGHSSQGGASDLTIGSRAVHMDQSREKLSILRWLRHLFRGWLRRPWV